MPNLRAQIVWTAESAKSLRQAIPSIAQRAHNKILSQSALIRKDIGELLATRFNQSAVVKSLTAGEERGLGAHLGLSVDAAAQLADDMERIIRESVRLMSGARSNVVIRVAAVPDEWGPYLRARWASYVSAPSRVVIPVAEWLLIDPDIDIGQGAKNIHNYDIVFRTEEEIANAAKFGRSRSGQALMMRKERIAALKKIATPDGYMLPAIARPVEGKNFIEYAINQPGVQEGAINIIRGYL